MHPTSPSHPSLHPRPSLDMSCVEDGQDDWMCTRPKHDIKRFFLYFPLQHLVETRKDGFSTAKSSTLYYSRSTYQMYQICTCDYQILYLVHMTGQYSDSLFHCCLPSASLERNLVTRSYTYSALFLLWDHIQSMCFCMCCITEVSQQCSFNNNFSGKSNRLIMKQGETSKQRQLGGRKEISCHSKECQDIFWQSSESSDCTTATEDDLKRISFGVVQEQTLKCD